MVLNTRRKVILSAVVVLLAIGVPAAANHVFTDVPATNSHHAAISEVADAGITTGCAAGRYCPGSPVTREQMATFLTRTGGSAYAADSTTVLAVAGGAASGVPVTVEVPGPGSGGEQNVVLQGSVTVYGTGAIDGCPCEVEAFLYRASDDAKSLSSWAILPGQTASSGDASVSLPVTWAVPQSSAGSERYDLAVFVDRTAVTSLQADAALTAVTVPFGSVPDPVTP
ncbi:MAG: S-layer homology domain-containing protein [Nitriliruptor sp.]|uniref:S-layer homology domain-containing protein n=1 Tax=Nitriliruptor sp. TaxID=2448056 RepID=UPI0034A06F99